MKVEEKYKVYAHLFFGFVVIYSLLMLYAIKLSDVSFFMPFVYVVFIFFNKLRLYLRQIRDEIFGFFSDSFTEPDKLEIFFSIIKSLFTIMMYMFFNALLIESLLKNFGETDPAWLIKIVYAHYFIFPIILIVWDIKRFTYWSNKRKESIKEQREKHLLHAERMEKLKNKVDTTENGTMTGYEPDNLATFELVMTSLMKGKPGAGLSGSNFDDKNVKAGALGELNFAKILQKNDYLNKYATYWSAQYPSKYSPGPDIEWDADIDCILVGNNTVYLLDLKLYSQGNVTWETSEDGNLIWSLDNVTGNFHKTPMKMSKNMSLATKRVKEKLEQLGVKMKVKPYVVMLPTNKGIGKVENVYWPGKVECVTIVDFLKVIEKEKPFNDHREDLKVLDSVFTWILKDESGKAPTFDF